MDWALHERLGGERAPEGPRRLLEKRGPGSVFGEIGLMTGAPRRATVVASTHVEAYRLDKAGFQSIIEQRPELADTLSRILERRLQSFAELEQGYAEGQGKTLQTTPGSADIVVPRSEAVSRTSCSAPATSSARCALASKTP